MNLIVFAGTTGFGKTEYLHDFAKFCLETNGLPADLSQRGSRKFLSLIKFEDELLREDRSSDSVPRFLDKGSALAKASILERAFQRVGRKIRAAGSKNVFLNIHLSYYKRSEFFPPLNLANFQGLIRYPSDRVKVVTLIDDVFVVWANIRKKEPSFPKTRMRLREIVSWRSVETLQADSLATNLTRGEEHPVVNNYLFAVRHPVYSLYNLVFQPEPICGVYVSYPISHTRTFPERVREVNQFRAKLHRLAAQKRAVVFDPATIDELALKFGRVEGDNVVIDSKIRWPLGPHEIVSEPRWPIVIPREEITEVLPDINNNITLRDFKLIDNTRFTVAYRPFYGGESVGMREEMRYTVGQAGRNVVVFNPKQDSQPKGENPFGATSYTECSQPNEFYKEVARRIKITQESDAKIWPDK